MTTSISLIELICMLSTLVAILMVGSNHLRLNIAMFSIQSALLSAVTFICAMQHREQQLYTIAIAFFLLKALGVPKFLLHIVGKVGVQSDAGTLLATPIAMHLTLGFMAIAHVLAGKLPVPAFAGLGWPNAASAISLVCTGLVLMLTRRIALSQIIGFLVMENGIYLFGMTQTHGMPMLVEAGIFLDVLAGVMIAGLITFRIKKSFEHIDVTLLSDLKE